MANQDFEAYRKKQGVIIRDYHADNRRLAENAFIYSVNAQGQKSYYRVNYHLQNVLSEKVIRDLQEKSRK